MRAQGGSRKGIKEGQDAWADTRLPGIMLYVEQWDVHFVPA